MQQLSDTESVRGLAEYLEVAPSTIRRWISKGYLVAHKKGTYYHIPFDSNSTFIFEKSSEKWQRPRSPYVPKEIGTYDKWHTVLDEICWLLKVTYSSREDLKARKFRIDSLLAAYLSPYIDNIALIRRALGEIPRRTSLVLADLRRGWYNELYFSTPLKPSTLGLSFIDIERNYESSENRFRFPSWGIISAYYACYFYVRTLSIQKEPEQNIRRHDASISAFKHHVAPALRSSLWAFPINISWSSKNRVSRSTLPVHQINHLQFQYAAHPRPPHRLPRDSFEFIYSYFRRRASKHKNLRIYTLIDFLREFRVWANYIDIDNLLKLKGPGYRAFLDQNLSTIIFFLAAISEFGLIAIQGSDKYVSELQSFYDGFVCDNPQLEETFTGSPMYQRMAMYDQLGLITKGIMLRTKFDINAVSARR